MYAILRAGGKQVKVSPGDVIRIERPSGGAEKGKTLTLSEVIFAGGADKPPEAKGVTVTATVLGPVRSRKVIVFKKKRTKQYRRTKGHRQNLVEIRIDSVEA